VGGRKGLLPEEISAIAVRETCKIELPAECATLLAGWWRSDPESEALKALIQELQANPSFGGQFTNQKLASIARLFGGRPMVSLEGPRSLVRAQQISTLYETYYHYALPFSRDVLRFVWEDCSVKGCKQSQQWLENRIGKINPSAREDFLLERPGSARPPQDEATDGTDLSPTPESE
jgi:hypothetical protein